jgi:hypothetical protein
MAVIDRTTDTLVVSYAEEALIREARRHARRQMLKRASIIAVAFAVATVGWLGFNHFTRNPPVRDPGAALAAVNLPKCLNAHASMQGSINGQGAAVTYGYIVQVLVSSSHSCTLTGFPIVTATVIGRHGIVSATDRISGVIGGLPAGSKLAAAPRIAVRPAEHVISFALEFVSGNGGQCPAIGTVRATIPGTGTPLPVPLPHLDYCGYLDVTPLVNGPTGRIGL